MINIFPISLGCPKNRVDTEHCLAYSKDFKIVESPDEADCIFINTCGFIGPAITESVRTILEYEDLKLSATEEKRPLLLVAGCLVGRFGKDDLAETLPEVDLFLHAQEVEKWGEKISQLFLEKKLSSSALSKSIEPRILSTPASYAWLKVSEGCRHSCAFCTIPFIRGQLKSTGKEILLDEARYILDQGRKELILIAQDLTAWGKDMNASLQDLLEPLLQLSGLERLRLLYLYPQGLTDELLSFLSEAGKPFVPYFDIPLQHASESVLKRMGRPFTDNPHAVIERVYKYFPDAALRTTFITGFPGETEEDFEELMDFVEEVRFHHMGVFAYEAEEGTKAAVMDGQILEKEKISRRDELMALQSEISEEVLSQYAGTVQEILVDYPHDEWPGLHVGRTWFQAPDIDGQTYVSGPGVEPGALIKAEISDTGIYDLSALSIETE